MHEVDVPPDQPEHIFKGMILLFEIDEGLRRKTPCSELLGGKNSESGEAFGILIGVRVEQSAVEDAENSGGRADAKGKRENCSEREARRFAKLTDSETPVQVDRVEIVLDAFSADHFPHANSKWARI